MLLEVKNLTKNFGGLRAVYNLNFSVEKHKLVGIIGPNGAGKSTLFNLLTGFVPPTTGTITLAGQRIDSYRTHQIARAGISRTFQTNRIIANETLMNNVMVGLLAKTQHCFWDAMIGLKKEEEDRFQYRCREVLKIVELEEMSGRVASGLDQEQQKRLAIAVAIVNNPKLLLLDEPTGGVNVEEIDKLTKIIRRIWEEGITVCLIEHKIKMVTELCEKVIVINYGEKIAEGTPEEVMKNKDAIRVYLGEENVA